MSSRPASTTLKGGIMYWIKVCSEWDNELHPAAHFSPASELGISVEWGTVSNVCLLHLHACPANNHLHGLQCVPATTSSIPSKQLLHGLHCVPTRASCMHGQHTTFAQSPMCLLQPHIYPAYNVLHSLQCVPATASSMPRIQTFTFPSLETLNSTHSEDLTNRLSKS